MKEKRAFKLLAKLEGLRSEHKEAVLCDKLAGVVSEIHRGSLSRKIGSLEERLRQNGYDPRRTEDID